MLTIQISVTVISIIFLSNYDTIYDIIDRKNKYAKYKRRFYIGVVIIVIGGNIALLVQASVASNTSDTILKSRFNKLDSAVISAGFKWDSNERTLTYQYTNQEGAIIVSGHASRTSFDHVSALYSPPHLVDRPTGQNIIQGFNSNVINSVIDNIVAEQQALHFEAVYIYSIDPSLQNEIINQMEVLLAIKHIKFMTLKYSTTPNNDVQKITVLPSPDNKFMAIYLPYRNF